MKRDMDLVRRLMLAAEGQPAGEHFFARDIMQADDDGAVIAEHVHLLFDAGYLTGDPDRTIAILPHPGRVLITGITWRGHEFLDAVRDDTVWQKTKAKLTATGGSATLEIVTQVATSILKQMLGLSV